MEYLDGIYIHIYIYNIFIDILFNNIIHTLDDSMTAFESRFWCPGEGAGQHALLERRFRVSSDLFPKDIQF